MPLHLSYNVSSGIGARGALRVRLVHVRHEYTRRHGASFLLDCGNRSRFLDCIGYSSFVFASTDSQFHSIALSSAGSESYAKSYSGQTFVHRCKLP